MRRTTHRNRRHQSGTFMFEISAAVLLLSLVILLGTQLTVSQFALRRSILRGEFIQQEAANVLERIYFLPWAEINQTSAQQIGDQVASETGRIQCTVTVSERTEAVAVKQIEVVVAPMESKAPQRRVRLSAWRFEAMPNGGNDAAEENR